MVKNAPDGADYERGIPRGVVIREEDGLVRTRAQHAKCEVVCQEGWEIPFERTLFAERGLRLDPDLIEAGMRWLGAWDVAAPLMGPGALAANVGSAGEREKTLALVHDLRVPVYSTELVFVARNETAQRFLEAWQGEGDGPLAFLRALYQVKPRFLALPRVWILRDGRVAPETQLVRPRQPQVSRAGQQMIQVEVSPGRFCKCWPGEEAKMIERYGQKGRHGNHI